MQWVSGRCLHQLYLLLFGLKEVSSSLPVSGERSAVKNITTEIFITHFTHKNKREGEGIGFILKVFSFSPP